MISIFMKEDRYLNIRKYYKIKNSYDKMVGKEIWIISIIITIALISFTVTLISK